MNSENQQKIIAFLQEHKTASGRQLAEVLGRDSRFAWNILMGLLRREILSHSGNGERRKLRLALNWQDKVCRQNWQGYQVHQIFGSAKS